LSQEESRLQERFATLLAWRRAQRREAVVLEAFFYAFLFSLAAIPLRESLPYGLSPLGIPLLLFPFVAAALFFRRPWSHNDSMRSLFLLDKSLGLEARALTAWDILGREEKARPELLVLAEAAERLHGVDLRALFRRRLSWQAWSLPAAVTLFLLLVWMGVGVGLPQHASLAPPGTLAGELKAFSHELKQRTRAEGLAESLKVASAMEELAERRIGGRMSEKQLREELAGLSKDIDARGPGSAPSGAELAAATRESLFDLKMEIETLAEALALLDPKIGDKELPPGLLGRLESLPRLSEELKRRKLPPEKLSSDELRRLLAELDRSISSELDRRTLEEIKQFLSVLVQGEGDRLADGSRENAPAQAGRSGESEPSRSPGILPGDRPGTKEPGAPDAPPFKPGVAAHLKGMLKEGSATSFRWQGRAQAGKSTVEVEDLIVSYRRQAEEEMASEKIPDGLKETVKNYFLSLGMTEPKTEKTE
jgi:hypothetical protein